LGGESERRSSKKKKKTGEEKGDNIKKKKVVKKEVAPVLGKNEVSCSSCKRYVCLEKTM